MSGVNIPITGDASSLVAATTRANTALASIGTAATAASGRITPALGSLSSGALKAAASLGPLAGVLSKISPDAGAAAESIAEMAATGQELAESAGAAAAAITGLAAAGRGLAAAGTAAGISMVAMAAVLGPVAIAVAALGAAYYVLNENMEAVEEKNRIAADKAAAAQKGFQDRTAVIKEIGDAYKVASGEQTAADQKAIALKEKLEASFAVEKANAQTALNYAKKHAQNTGAGSDADKARILAEKRLAAVNGQIEYQIELIDQTIRLDGKKENSIKGVNNAQADADKRKNEAARALKTAVDAVAGAEKELAKITHDASMTHASEMEKETDLYEAKVARTVELGEIELANAELLGTDRTEIVKRMTDAQFALAGEHALNVRNLQKEELAAKKKLEEDKLAAEEDAEEESKKANEDAAKVKKDQAMDLANFMVEQAAAGLSALAEGFELAQETANNTAQQLTDQLIAGDATYTKAQKAELVKRIAEQRANAKEAFAIAKAARLAEAVITTAMAVINAYNSGVALPIGGAVLGPAMAIAAGVTGAVSIATIAAEQPSFHSGRSPDEMQATILRKEAVLNTTAAASMGRKQVEAMNNGMTGGARGGPAPIVLGHRVFEAGLKRSLDSAGVLREALNSGAVYGHRTNRRISSV